MLAALQEVVSLVSLNWDFVNDLLSRSPPVTTEALIAAIATRYRVTQLPSTEVWACCACVHAPVRACVAVPVVFRGSHRV